mgnify:CR=1 FL=1
MTDTLLTDTPPPIYIAVSVVFILLIIFLCKKTELEQQTLTIEEIEERRWRLRANNTMITSLLTRLEEGLTHNEGITEAMSPRPPSLHATSMITNDAANHQTTTNTDRNKELPGDEPNTLTTSTTLYH